jgi:prephenate dehydratase
VSNKAGALAKVLNIFAEEGINMSKIQSMPVLGKRNEYNFYVDIEWEDAKNYDTAIRKILKYTQNFNILGEYERHDDEANVTPKPVKTEKTPRTYINIKKI